jgi:hypothetical protein
MVDGEINQFCEVGTNLKLPIRKWSMVAKWNSYVADLLGLVHVL